MTAAWLDRIAADLLHVEHDVRGALRAYSRGQRHPRIDRLQHDQVLIRVHEARTLLRGAMPAPIAATGLRQQHARMVAALQHFGAHLVALNDPAPSDPNAALAASVTLMAELREWHRQADWNRAARAARVRFPVPNRPINAVLRPRTPAPAERLPNAAAGQLHHPAAALRLVAQLRAQQLALDLAPPPAAELVDLRQLRLQLAA